MPAEGASKRFGYVQTYDTKPKRRLFEVHRDQGMQQNHIVYVRPPKSSVLISAAMADIEFPLHWNG
jgi:hypothetical protein